MLAAALSCLALMTLAVLALLVRRPRIVTQLRAQNAALESGARDREAELRHLVAARLPVLDELQYGHPVEVPGPLKSSLADTAYGSDIEAIAATFAEIAERARKRADEFAKVTLMSMMRAVQSLANEQQLAISGMQSRHDDPEVLEGLLQIDHMNAQLGRRAQVTAVLCGSWPGQQRSASALIDVVRGATSRIRDYARVRVSPEVNVAVVSRAVEPVVLAIAELLDNAARHSQPGAPVEVDFRPAHNGLAIVIDDAGVAMTADEVERAARLLAPTEAVDINRLGDPPQVGFAVVGVLAARYGFSVSVDTRSPYGGVRAVVFLPNALLTRQEIPVRAALAITPDQVPGPAPDTEAAPSRTPGGLPRRRRASPAPAMSAPPADDGPPAEHTPAAEHASAAEHAPAAADGTLAEAPSVGAPARATVDARWPSGRSSQETAASLGAWQRGSRSGRDSAVRGRHEERDG